VDNRVVQLCAAGMAIDGDPAAAHSLFMQAWESRLDDFDASIAAHFLARHQTSPQEALHWNCLALQHAEAVAGSRANPLFASLHLNLGESYRALGRYSESMASVTQGLSSLAFLPPDGYRDFIARGLERLQERLSEIDVGRPTSNTR
jgi:hypothetical protein